MFPLPPSLAKVDGGGPVSLERVPEGERRREDAERQVREGQRGDERVPRVGPQLPVDVRYVSYFLAPFLGHLYDFTATEDLQNLNSATNVVMKLHPSLRGRRRGARR